MQANRKENFNPDNQETDEIMVSTRNDLDPINELICSNCLLFQNCSAHCEHLVEIYARIGQEFYDKEYIYQPNLMRTKKQQDMIVEKMTHIINKYLKEKEICYGTERDV
jgi:hypothetical protein